MASYSVYVIETDKYLEQGISLPSVYVGMTSLSIEERFKERLTSREFDSKSDPKLEKLREREKRLMGIAEMRINEVNDDILNRLAKWTIGMRDRPAKINSRNSLSTKGWELA